MRQICKMEKLENFCKKGMHPKEIHEDFMEAFAKESLSYNTVKKWAAGFKSGGESIVDDGRSSRPKDAIANETVKVVHTLVICDRRRDLRNIASEVGKSFGRFCGSTINPSRQRFRQEGRREHCTMIRKGLCSLFLGILSCYDDDPGDFIERLITKDET